MKSASIRYGIFLLIIFSPGINPQCFSQLAELYINEFQASNISSVRNPYTGSFEDWFEIYNAGTVGVEIGGYFLTDDPQNPQKWQIPFDSIVHPDAYIIFWADDIDEFNHTNFKLGRSGEFIGLYDEQGNVIDSVSFGYQEDDISYGRIKNDLQHWAFYETPTPGYANSDVYLTARAESPVFSLTGGFHTGSQSVSLAASDPGIQFYYTLDGTIPDESDQLYTQPIVLDTTTALRIRGYASGKLPGDIITQTYFIDEEINLPFISLATDPANLFDDEIGIYVIGTNGVPGYCTDKPMNVNQDWERPVNVELYDVNGNVELNQRAGLKIYGGCSRTRYPQKSLSLFARGVYGKGSFDVQLFKDKPIYEFESFVLRNSADDCRYTMFKDAMGQAILEKTHIDRQAYRPAVVFINGQYWGIHNIREKINEHYVAENYNLNVSEVNLLTRNPENEWNVVAGSAAHYNIMVNYVSMQDMNADEDYQYVAGKMDIDNYIDYQVAEIYLSANDWPSNNIKFWRASSGPHDRWRWIIYDLDNCFFYIERNTLELATDPWCNCNWPNPPWSTLLFRRLLINEQFRNEFIQRYAWHMNTTFLEERIIHYIDSMKANIASEIPRHIERWGGQTVPEPEHWIGPTFNSMEEWESHIDGMKRFVSERRPHATQHVLDYFGIEGMVNVVIQNTQPEAGILEIADQPIQGVSHTGEYFMNIPLTIKAIPALGYKFSFWEYGAPGSGTQQLNSPVLDIVPEEDFSLVAYFENTQEPDPVVVINEINYHSGEEEDLGDWVEFFNRKDEIIDLSGWTFQDEQDDHIFTIPKGVEIGPNGFLVLCEDISAFRLIFPDVTNAIGNLGFGLSNGGELIRLFALDHSMIDAVHYDDQAPWPEEADGLGPTLELIDPSLNNDLAENWTASYGIGTPGRQNFSNTIEKHSLSQNYPNPCGSSTYIPVSMQEPGYLSIQIHDIFGRHISTIVNKHMEKSAYQFSWDTSHLPTGIYLYTMTVDNQRVDTKKMVVLR
jgi:hypothetical protein